ncbi:MAG: hypothetical protein U0451_03905 [Candidatus Saccharimonadales bacterium]
MDSNFDETMKLESLSERLINLAVSVVLGAMALALAYWIGHYSGLIPTLVYWFFSVGTLYALLNGIIGIVFGYALKADVLFWAAFFLNIPIQMLISHL